VGVALVLVLMAMVVGTIAVVDAIRDLGEAGR
jgi:hypothetical protein